MSTPTSSPREKEIESTPVQSEINAAVSGSEHCQVDGITTLMNSVRLVNDDNTYLLGTFNPQLGIAYPRHEGTLSVSDVDDDTSVSESVRPNTPTELDPIHPWLPTQPALLAPFTETEERLLFETWCKWTDGDTIDLIETQGRPFVHMHRLVFSPTSDVSYDDMPPLQDVDDEGNPVTLTPTTHNHIPPLAEVDEVGNSATCSPRFPR
ncbi:hypothetical protein NLI96_g10754 [Meripilus lineatus]|uniref:Uncharacterized protein n=1 Tax=Meripilus lineatus TaxID=2056292 RepID=A0AAD5UVF1_9APHY|nr:hypothetical protein NLI96_g10754 [Physisporinus lineatus]